MPTQAARLVPVGAGRCLVGLAIIRTYALISWGTRGCEYEDDWPNERLIVRVFFMNRLVCDEGMAGILVPRCCPHITSLNLFCLVAHPMRPAVSSLTSSFGPGLDATELPQVQQTILRSDLGILRASGYSECMVCPAGAQCDEH